jgi:endonuclease/exonuclease/phosphatase family metal-dependent hydrolase
MDLGDVYRIFHPISAQYIIFSSPHETFSTVDHILRHKANLSKYKKIGIITCMISDHNALKLELNKKKQY